MSSPLRVETVSTTPYTDQKPGTSGLRKKVTVFQQPNYLANFVQSIFDSLDQQEFAGKTLLISGDGRYYNKEAISICTEIAAGNGVCKVLIAKDGLCSTPAASCIIRAQETCCGGIILTASHNPGGPNEDFGVKFNTSNGGPALETLTDRIFNCSKEIRRYRRVALPTTIDLATLSTHNFVVEDKEFSVQVIDGVEDWMKQMKNIFDFDLLKELIQTPKFKFVYDGMNGVAGPYAKRLFVDELGAPESSLLRCDPQQDFGGHHPDPNLTYAKTLVDMMRVRDPEHVDPNTPAFGAAGDGDCDRNMILGKGWFVTPSDSVAIITSYAREAIPYFRTQGIKGVARSMPTSMALTNVAQSLGIAHYEVPTGWKFFGNLMDHGMVNICGEESFGTGSDHCREKDGLWAVLAWMSLIAYRARTSSQVISVKQINEEFWERFGRNYYTRYDYENVDVEDAKKVFEEIRALGGKSLKRDENLSQLTREYLEANAVDRVDEFEYKDLDGTIAKNQGLRIFFANGSRFILRLSGTGSAGATIRLYLERYVPPGGSSLHLPTAEAMEDFVGVALDMAKIEKHTGRKHPTVIT